MATLQQLTHWRDRAIQRSEVISDAWQVFLAYSGRGAEIVLFLCMAVSLIQMIPTISLNDTFTGAVFVVNMITLDIAGFGLNSLAKAVGRLGDTETAKKAGTIGTCLIVIMIISMLSGGISRLFGTQVPAVKTWMVGIDDVLILVRVGMTVLYGKIMHSLRDSQQHIREVADETEARLREELAQAREAVTQKEATLVAEQTSTGNLKQQVTALEGQLEEAKKALLSTSEGQGELILKLQQSVAEMTTSLQQKQGSLERLNQDLQSAQGTIFRLQQVEQQEKALAETVKEGQQKIADLTGKLSQAERKSESLQEKLVKAQSEKTRESDVKAGTVKAGNITSIDQARKSVKTDDAAVLAYIQLYPQMKVPEVAEHFGVTARTVYNILKRQSECESTCESEVVAQS